MSELKAVSHGLVPRDRSFDYKRAYRMEVLKFYIRMFGVGNYATTRAKVVYDRCIVFGELGGFKCGSVCAAFVYQDGLINKVPWEVKVNFSQRNIAKYFGVTEVSIRNILKKWNKQQEVEVNG